MLCVQHFGFVRTLVQSRHRPKLWAGFVCPHRVITNEEPRTHVHRSFAALPPHLASCPTRMNRTLKTARTRAPACATVMTGVCHSAWISWRSSGSRCSFPLVQFCALALPPCTKHQNRVRFVPRRLNCRDMCMQIFISFPTKRGALGHYTEYSSCQASR